jgi:tetratricopeptide (TPR) repeat protein
MKNNIPTKSRNSSKPAQSDSRHGGLRWLVALIVLAISCVPFLPILSNQFVDWDDFANLVDNPHFKGLGSAQLNWMFTTFHMGHYQPLSWMTFGFDYLLWGMDPFGYHLTNIILHVANTGLFYFVSRRLLSIALCLADDEKNSQLNLSAAVSALLFGMHPLRVESVAWATERRDVLSGFFYLLTIYCYIRSTDDQPSRAHRRWLGAAIAGHALSLLSKGTAMTLPAVLLLLDIYPLRRLKGRIVDWFKPASRRVLSEKLPFVFLAGVFAIIALLAQNSTGALKTLEQYDLTSRIGQIFFATMFYLWKSLAPVRLSALYELPPHVATLAWIFILSGVGFVAISIVLFSLRRRWPAVLASWAYYIIILAPVSGIAQSGPQLVADRYSYLACLSWAVLVGGWSFRFWPSAGLNQTSRSFSAVTITAAIAVLFVLGILTWNQTKVWQNPRTLWQHAIVIGSNSGIAYYNLGKIFEAEGETDQSIELYRRAISINPEYAKAHHNLANLLLGKGIQTEALGHYRRALQINPEDPDTHTALGVLYDIRGDLAAALEEFHKALRLDPNHARAFFNVGRVLAQKGDLEQAASNYRQAARLDPGEAIIQIGLADVLARQGDLESATSHLVTAVKLNPDSADAHILLARALAAQGKKEAAEKHYLQALKIMRSPAAGDRR